MENLTDEEVLGLVQLFNDHLDRECDGTGIRPNEVVLVHRQSGKAAEIMPLLRKMLRESVSRGLIKVPACFKGEL